MLVGQIFEIVGRQGGIPVELYGLILLLRRVPSLDQHLFGDAAHNGTEAAGRRRENIGHERVNVRAVVLLEQRLFLIEKDGNVNDGRNGEAAMGEENVDEHVRLVRDVVRDGHRSKLFLNHCHGGWSSTSIDIMLCVTRG